MKIIINLNAIKRPLTGIGYYTKNILQELIDTGHDVVAIRHVKLLRGKEISNFLGDIDKSKLENTEGLKKYFVETLRNVPGTYFFKHIILSFILNKRLKALSKSGYIYFEPSFVPIKFLGKTITTIHDLSFVSHPDFHPEERVRYLKKMLKRTLQVSDHILVDSDFIKDELCSLYPSYASKVSTLYLGADKSFTNVKLDSDVEYLKSVQLLENQYVLCVGTLEPRKNLARLIDGYSNLSNEIRDRYPLVLVGSVGWKNNEFDTKLKKLRAKGQVRVSGYVSDTQLKCLYRSAAVFVYPSLYEGFGLPVIEAMSSGTPVITSDIGATKEVAGNCAELVDPFSIDDISRGLKNLLSSEIVREKYKKAGLKRVEYFSWKKCSNDLVNIIQSI
jgi:glycosyltransferase involved in cell wall biosynthesis